MKIKNVQATEQQEVLEIMGTRTISDGNLLIGYFQSADMYSCRRDASEYAEYVLDELSVIPRLAVPDWIIDAIKRDKVREDEWFRKQKEEDDVERRYAEAAQRRGEENDYEYYNRLLACCDIEKDVVHVTRCDGTSIDGVLQKFSSDGIQIGFFRYMSGMCDVVRLPVNGWCALDQISRISVGRNEMRGFFKRKEEEWAWSVSRRRDVNDI